MKWLLAFALCSSLALQAAGKSPAPEPQQPPAYDADLFKKDTPVFSFHGSFLYWRVQESALDYALKMRQPAWGSSASFAQGKFEKTTFNGEPGFRFAASYFRAPNYWEIFGVYTRLTAAGEDNSTKPTAATEFLTGTWPQTLGSTSTLARANTRIHLNYNVAELLVDRYFNPNPHLRLRVIGGAMVAWINQDWHIHYSVASNATTKIRNRWEYVGGGFRVGTWVDWFWTHDIYMTAEMTSGVVMGLYRNRAEQIAGAATANGDNVAIPVRKADYRDARPAFTVQASLGPSWQKNFKGSRVEVFAGYELNTWFNLHEVYRSTSNTSSDAKETWINTGLVTLQGLTTRVTVDF